ncbi:MAG: lipopolysaccharide heptosyltransferase II [Cyclobacteriaceae bacterium]
MKLTPQKILIVRLSAIGDIILTTPLVRAVRTRFPKAEIHFLTKKGTVCLLENNPAINKVIPFDSKTTSLKDLIAETKAENYDWIIDIHKNLRSRMLRWFGGAKLTTTYNKSYVRRMVLLYFRIRSAKPIVPVIDKYFQAVSKFGIENDNKGTEVFFTKSDQQKVDSIFKKEDEKKLVTICPGASFTTKQWKLSGFEEVGRYYVKKGCQVVFLGGPTDIEVCETLAKKVDGISVAGKLKLLESAALLKQSDVAITNDSGMLHLAQSQQTPIVAIYGPTTKDWGFFPVPEKSRVVEHEGLNCRPCHSKGSDNCPKRHFKCMNEIGSSSVINAVNELV